MSDTNGIRRVFGKFVGSPLILIAGESTDTRELYSLVLASQGFSVIQADDSNGRSMWR